SRRSAVSSVFSSLVSPSLRTPSSRSACRTQFPIDVVVGPNSHDSSPSGLPLRASSITRRRNSRSYGGLLFGIVGSLCHSGTGSTKPGQLHQRATLVFVP